MRAAVIRLAFGAMAAFVLVAWSSLVTAQIPDAPVRLRGVVASAANAAALNKGTLTTIRVNTIISLRIPSSPLRSLGYGRVRLLPT